jgi:ankyrin repeat protein
MAKTLLAAGARADAFARGDGGTPLVVALFWGHREVADVLAEHGVHPCNLRAAAGLGRTDLIDDLVALDGRLAPEAGAHRAYYRPHGGFPLWDPSDDPQEVIDEALAWAARSDRVDALDVLVERGANLEADVYRGTPLTWAAAMGRTAAVRRLIALGADPNGRSTFGGPSHGEGVTPLHLAAGDGHLEVIVALLDAGADPTLRDALYDGPAVGWAEHWGHTAAVELLQERSG